MIILRIIGICLIILGSVSLFYKGVSFVIPKDVFDLKYFSITIKENRIIPLSPIAGLVSLIIGIVLVMLISG